MTPYLNCTHSPRRSNALTFVTFAALGGLSGWAGVMGTMLYLMG